ncbi:MAG: hypothetical protein CSA15_01515 [Candidatus Delongbacteria bacterium]|nr:MAG: hypothetical protein CSA15_01515 [Candidatus Delongbacteria bacterium]
MFEKLFKIIFSNKILLPFYHHVSEKQPIHTKHLFKSRNISHFRSDLDYFLKHYNPVSVDDIYRSIFKNYKLPQNPFLLSFDDGFSEVESIVAPILKEKGLPAIFFLNGDFIDNKDMMFRCKASILIEINNISPILREQLDTIKDLFQSFDLEYTNFKDSVKSISYNKKDLLDKLLEVGEFDIESYLKNKKPYLTTDQILSLKKDGFDFGSHSMDHPYYGKISEDKQIEQTLNSLEKVQNIVNSKLKLFSFPFSEEGVRESFYEKISPYLDLTFGTFDNKFDPIKFSLQRFAMEDYGDRISTTEESVKSFYKRSILRIPFGKSSVKRV